MGFLKKDQTIETNEIQEIVNKYSVNGPDAYHDNLFNKFNDYCGKEVSFASLMKYIRQHHNLNEDELYFLFLFSGLAIFCFEKKMHSNTSNSDFKNNITQNLLKYLNDFANQNIYYKAELQFAQSNENKLSEFANLRSKQPGIFIYIAHIFFNTSLGGTLKNKIGVLLNINLVTNILNDFYFE